MPKRGRVSIKRGYTPKKDDMLRTKYFCQLTKNRLLEVVMEISAPPRPNRKRPPLRYVLVIDVSSSMKYKVGKSAESLLDRVKVFAELVIRKVTNKDSVGIVSFARDVKVEFPMTVMTNDSKSLALGIVRSLTVRGGTNLELGMMTGLNILKESPSFEDKDLIIIFTDGEANKGIVDAEILIENYREAQMLLGKSSCVPISAFTIGHYVPVLLDKLARNLGSDAFYWLNENEEFESDMLIPIFLREEARVTDVLIELTCLEDVTFDVDSAYRTSQMNFSRDSLSLFVHSFPQEMRKHIPLRFTIPPHIKNENQKKIADIVITYLDDEMNQRVKNDSIVLSSVILNDIAKIEETELSDSHCAVLDAISAYTIKNNVINTSLKAAEKSLIAIADSKYKIHSMTAFDKIMKSISNDEESSGRERDVRGTVSEIHKINDDYVMVFNALNGKTSNSKLDDLASGWIEEIKFAASMNSKKSLGRLFAMKSSLNNEMPPAKGVFGPHRDRPFVPSKVEHKLQHYEKLVAATKEKRRKELEELAMRTRKFKSQVNFESSVDKTVGPKRGAVSEIVLKSESRPDPGVNAARTDTALYSSNDDTLRKEKQTGRGSLVSDSRTVDQTTSEPLPRIERLDTDQTSSDPSSAVDSLRMHQATSVPQTANERQNVNITNETKKIFDRRIIDRVIKELQEDSGREKISQSTSLPLLERGRQNVDYAGSSSQDNKEMHHATSLLLTAAEKQKIDLKSLTPLNEITRPLSVSEMNTDEQAVEQVVETTENERQNKSPEMKQENTDKSPRVAERKMAKLGRATKPLSGRQKTPRSLRSREVESRRNSNARRQSMVAKNNEMKDDSKINRALVEIERRRGSHSRRQSVREMNFQSMKQLTGKSPLTESEKQKMEEKTNAEKKKGEITDQPETEVIDLVEARKRLYGTRRLSLRPVEKVKEEPVGEVEAPEPTDGRLITKYHCQITKKKDIDLLMKITATRNMIGKQFCMRYVLVIDVSESMDSNVGRTSDSLLDRIKVFAEVMIQKISSKDSLAIITFSETAKVDFPLTVMMSDAKEKATEIVRAIESRGETNLERGIMTALNVLQRSSSDNSRDAIFLFTDGEPTEGQKDSAILVENYRAAQIAMGKRSYIPLITFTIGKYIPSLLNSLACQLGSEAFYWLNLNEEFERDMLIPLILREETSVTDVNIKMTCCDGVVFNSDFTYKTAFMELTKIEMKNFIYSIPEGTARHIPLRLTLTDDMENVINNDIVHVTITYLDSSMQEKTINDSVKLIGHPPSDEDDEKEKSAESNDVIAYSVMDNIPHSTKEAALDSLSAIADSKCRVLSMAAISKVLNSIKNAEKKLPGRIARETILAMNRINTRYKSLIDPDSQQSLELRENVGNWIARVNFSGTLQDKRSLGRIFSMKTSVENEAPSAKGVFDPQQRQPYTNTDLENKLIHYDKVVRMIRRARREVKYAKLYGEFRAQNVLLSESLRHKKVGRKHETLQELIVKSGGRPVPNVNTMYHNTILVCDGKDLKENTVLVRDAKRAKIPILREQYIHDCVTQRTMISKLQPYLH